LFLVVSFQGNTDVESRSVLI